MLKDSNIMETSAMSTSRTGGHPDQSYVDDTVNLELPTKKKLDEIMEMYQKYGQIIQDLEGTEDKGPDYSAIFNKSNSNAGRDLVTPGRYEKQKTLANKEDQDRRDYHAKILYPL
jgi:hypothetical protein